MYKLEKTHSVPKKFVSNSNKPLIIKILDRLIKLKDILIVAIPNNKENTELEKILKKMDVKSQRSWTKRLKRYYHAAKNLDWCYSKNYFRLSFFRSCTNW